MEADVLEVREHVGQVRVWLRIFGRPVPVDLEDYQVEHTSEPESAGPPMTEQAWHAAQSPQWLLTHVRRTRPRPSERKCRLFTCACARRLFHLLQPGERQAVETAERAADREVGRRQLKDASSAVAQALASAVRGSSERFALQVAAVATAPNGGGWQLRAAVDAMGEHVASCLVPLLRDVLGNPFRPLKVDPAWLRWERGAVGKLARSIYQERAFQDLPVLADALEDTGCADADLLAHCRGPGPHARGCFVLDALLGKQ
jgi:hypothetical protein